ncbi:MAG: outer membrane lipoprotein-sorting protein [Myxococcota bacterium]|nr:outer membrane lipoprotein-sorting protein [Myxococcota bacterium]
MTPPRPHLASRIAGQLPATLLVLTLGASPLGAQGPAPAAAPAIPAPSAPSAPLAPAAAPATSPPTPPPGSPAPDLPLAQRIVLEQERLLRGQASIGELELFIQRWERTLRVAFWERYPDRFLATILEPAAERGSGALKLGQDLHTYDPRIDQVQRIPTSLLLDPWMGSEFTNDDISRASSIARDYDAGPPIAGSRAGVTTWRVPLVPKPSSPVVWERLVLEVAQDDLRPLREEFYDERDELVRVLLFEDFRLLDDGRRYPFRWRMENHQVAGRYTEVRIQSIRFADSLPDDLFSLRSLKQPR